jgi:methionine sulfoxide reductase heme-binding subunit
MAAASTRRGGNAPGWWRVNWLRAAAHGIAVALAAWLVLGYARETLGFNPVQKLTQETGLWGIRLLMASIACTPLMTLTGWRAPGAARRAFGLYGFFFIAAHLLTFSVLDFGLDLGLLAIELTEKPYIIAGALGFLAMLPLAITSTRGWMKRLGTAWKRLHRVFYIALALGVLHFWWSQKNPLNEALFVYTPVLALLLAARLPRVRKAIAGARRQVGST